MSALTFSLASTEADVDLAFELALSVFGETSDLQNYEYFKYNLWREDPAYALNNFVLARARDGSVRGLVRIVPRKIFRGQDSFAVAGISSVCLSPDARGKGGSIALMEYSLRSCRARGFDFAFLFARRAADYYYTRFGFHGVSSYSQLSVKCSDWGGAQFELREPCEQDVEMYGAAYNYCYANVFGRVERSLSYWRFLLHKFQDTSPVKIRSIYVSGSPVGYALLDDSVVYELAFGEPIETKALVAFLVRNLTKKAAGDWANFELPPQHALVPALHGMDVRVTQRECPFGGHMACVLNVDALIDRMAKRYPESVGKLAPLRGRLELDHRETCQLLGVSTITGPTESCGQSLPYNMSLADHF